MSYLLLYRCSLFCFHGSLFTLALLDPCVYAVSVDDGQEIMNEAEEPTPPQEETDGQDGQQQCKSFSLKR
jgi:hypothetical protein